MKLRDMLGSVGRQTAASSSLVLHLLHTASRTDYKRCMSKFRTMGIWQLRALLQTAVFFYLFRTTCFFAQDCHSAC